MTQSKQKQMVSKYLTQEQLNSLQLTISNDTFHNFKLVSKKKNYEIFETNSGMEEIILELESNKEDNLCITVGTSLFPFSRLETNIGIDDGYFVTDDTIEVIKSQIKCMSDFLGHSLELV
jgi:hypothetical protein